MNKLKFAKKIKALRSEKNWTQATFAKKARINYVLISHWENGRYTPSFANAIKIAKAFKISLDELAR